MSCSTPACPPTNVKFQLRRATSVEWASKNPILRPGEPGVETNTGQMKIGNEACDRWNDLPYVGGNGPTGPSGISGSATNTGATGPTGARGPQYLADVNHPIPRPNVNDTLDIMIAPNLQYSINNSVLITNRVFPDTRFEGIVESYDASTGSMRIHKITNVFGTHYLAYDRFKINLTGERGHQWYVQTGNPNIVASVLGRFGDLYIDQESGNVFMKNV